MPGIATGIKRGSMGFIHFLMPYWDISAVLIVLSLIAGLKNHR